MVSDADCVYLQITTICAFQLAFGSQSFVFLAQPSHFNYKHVVSKAMTISLNDKFKI